jgi:mannose-6-phosphate isomerase-like protein (cupin superfamily)
MDNYSIIDRSRVTKDWHGRGFSCGMWIDHAGREWKDVAHETDELFMVMAGKLELELEGKPLHPSVGQEIHIPGGMTYTIRNIGGTTACWLYGHKRTVAPAVQPIDPIGDLFPSPQ